MTAFDTPIRAVLFDFDGTLFDSECLHYEAWLEAVKPWGVTLSWDDYRQRLVGISDTHACEFSLDLAGKPRT
ncbi:MAG: HAD hydrolase-like protein, partial [Bryobacterales bacterium]|nr:HAD hydrolase-like protein [Bryobacterales bacterium]